jgi:IrrE N-terminal-like domain
MFRRGFKAWCEQVAVRVRKERGIPASDPVTPAQVAQGLNVRLLPATELPGVQADVLSRLTNHHRSSWSAITLSEADRHLVVFNPAHSKARQSSDVMHELAHIILKHTPTFFFINPEKKLLIRSHDRVQEEEASWLAAAVLLPRQVLLYVRSRRLSDEEVCRRYSVSKQLLVFRVNATGVERQLARRSGTRR